MIFYDGWKLQTPIFGVSFVCLFFLFFYFLEWLVGHILGHKVEGAAFMENVKNTQ